MSLVCCATNRGLYLDTTTTWPRPQNGEKTRPLLLKKNTSYTILVWKIKNTQLTLRQNTIKF